MWVWSLGQEDPLKQEMATHSSILAWKIPRTEEPGGLQSLGLQSQTWLSRHARDKVETLVLSPTLCFQSNSKSTQFWELDAVLSKEEVTRYLAPGQHQYMCACVCVCGVHVCRKRSERGKEKEWMRVNCTSFFSRSHPTFSSAPLPTTSPKTTAKPGNHNGSWWYFVMIQS